MGHSAYYPQYSPAWSNSYYTPVRGEEVQAMPAQTFLSDPYVVQTLQTVVGKMLVVNTGHGTVRGRLVTVKPDHIVIQEPEGKSTFFVRIQKIVWIMPD